MKVSLVAALDRNRGIGRGNGLPWRLPDDLKRFAKKLVKLGALYADHGTGPDPDSLVLPRLNWGRMTQPINSERDLDCDD